MTMRSIGNMNNKFIGLSTDTNPTNVEPGATVFQYDTKNYIITPDDGSNWVLHASLYCLSGVALTTIDLNQIAGTYDLFTVTSQNIVLEALTIIIPRDMSADEDITSISIQTNDSTPQVIISSIIGAVANLIENKHLNFLGSTVIEKNKKIQLTIAGGAADETTVCNVFASYRALIAGGYLA